MQFSFENGDEPCKTTFVQGPIELPEIDPATLRTARQAGSPGLPPKLSRFKAAAKLARSWNCNACTGPADLRPKVVPEARAAPECVGDCPHLSDHFSALFSRCLAPCKPQPARCCPQARTKCPCVCVELAFAGMPLAPS